MLKKSEKIALVTGANGLLGQKVIEQFAPHFLVIATGIQPEPVRAMSGVTYLQLDITNYGDMQRMMKRFEPDFVINCAAYTNVDKAEEEKELTWEINATAVRKMVRMLRRIGAKFVQISTDYIFDGQEGPYSEEARPEPLGYYGTSKLAAENAVIASGIDHLIFRTNVLYGTAAGMQNNFVLWVKRSLESQQTIRVVDDQFNNPTLANGLAECILMACIMNGHGVYNYAGTDWCNRYEFAQKIAEYFDLNSDLITPCKTEELNQTAPRPMKSGLITDKVVADLHISLYDIKAGLKQMEKDLL